jgi:group I intron endonuclease
MIGIYMITNPNGKIYIGQSIDIEKRFDDYKKLKCKNQIKLYGSLKKYGYDLHSFDIIEECEFNKLNERERYWQENYDVINNGLNLLLTSTNNLKQIVSSETKEKIKNTVNEYYSKLDKEILNERISKSSQKRKGCVGNRKGSTLSDEQKKKISITLKGHAVSDKTKEKIRNKMINRNVTWGDKISKANKGISRNLGKNLKPIIQYGKNGELLKEWDSITDASNTLNLSFNNISNALCGYSKSASGFIWKYKNLNDD